MATPYLADHQTALEAAITAAVGAAVRARAQDPIAFVAQRLAAESTLPPTLTPPAKAVSYSRAAIDDAEYLSWHGEPMARAFGHALRSVLTQRAADPLLSFAEAVVKFAEESALKRSEDEDGLRRLQHQDPELHEALAGLLGAFCKSSLRLCMRCRIAAAPSNPALDIIIDVAPEGASARMYGPSAEWPVAPCTISCERDVLISIIRGDTSPMNALLGGAVVVDDLVQLMAFSSCFDFEAVRPPQPIRPESRAGRFGLPLAPLILASHAGDKQDGVPRGGEPGPGHCHWRLKDDSRSVEVGGKPHLRSPPERSHSEVKR